jgi:2-polyprenyl-3-methyl-5-hydroxy-6-metoxy-1,4-benzoquinol methylase
VFSKKIPSEKELENHYEGYSRNDYLSPITIKRYNEILDEFEKHRKTNKLLDVGCGIGYFLEEAKKRGWEVYGTEYTEEAIEICSNIGISMQKGVLTPSNYDLESFDIITSFEVIEHINNPTEELNNFHELLRKGGITYVTTPNFNSILRYRLKSAYNVISYPEHLSYFTPKTLNKVFNSGFKTKKITTTGFSFTRLKTSIGKSNQPIISIQSDDEKIRNLAESNKLVGALKIIINQLLTLFGFGDHLKGWFVKK